MPAAKEPRLSPTQLSILTLIAQGHTYRIIAATMSRTPSSVRRHQFRINRALGARNGAHAVAEALRRGIID